MYQSIKIDVVALSGNWVVGELRQVFRIATCRVCEDGTKTYSAIVGSCKVKTCVIFRFMFIKNLTFHCYSLIRRRS